MCVYWCGLAEYDNSGTLCPMHILKTAIAVVMICAPAAQAETVRVAVFNIWELSADKIDSIDSTGKAANRSIQNSDPK